MALRAAPCHNLVVLRRALLAAVFCVIAWTAGVQTMSQDRDTGPRLVAACAVTGETQPGSGSDGLWHAAPRADAALTESFWKSSKVHASLAATRSAGLFVTRHPADPPARSSRYSPGLPRRIPLLI